MSQKNVKRTIINTKYISVTLILKEKDIFIFILNKMAINSDEIVMLTDCSLPLMSFSYIIEAASPCCGKTFQMMKMADAYIQ